MVDLNPRYTFSTFVVGDSNYSAHSACFSAVGSSGKGHNPVFIYGQEGTGKTHLLTATAELASKQNLNFIYTTVEDFINDYIEAVSMATTIEFRKKYRLVDMLIIDDIQVFKNKPGVQEEFFCIFDDLLNSGKQVLIASNRPPGELLSFKGDLLSKLSSGLVAEITPPDSEMKKAIIKERMKTENIDMPEVIDYLGNIGSSNIRKLEGLIERVSAYASLKGEKITLSLVEEAVRILKKVE